MYPSTGIRFKKGVLKRFFTVRSTTRTLFKDFILKISFFCWKIHVRSDFWGSSRVNHPSLTNKKWSHSLHLLLFRRPFCPIFRRFILKILGKKKVCILSGLFWIPCDLRPLVQIPPLAYGAIITDKNNHTAFTCSYIGKFDSHRPSRRGGSCFRQRCFQRARPLWGA